MSERIHNFGAGPAALPLEVLERVREDLIDFEGTGRSILETSHRSPQYDRVHEAARERFLRLLGATSDFEVLFMGGGARTQFSLVPMNLCPGGQSADYLVTGRWSELALSAAEQQGCGRPAWSGARESYRRLPGPSDYSIDSGARFCHYTSNNTIYGTQFDVPPDSGGIPLVADVSSDVLSRPLDLSRFDLFYAGAQKNLGPAGVTVVAIRRSLLEEGPNDLPDMFSYRAVAAKRSLLNTPPVFAIYVMNLVLERFERLGGVAAAAERNREKSDLLYRTLDDSEGFYQPHAARESRSWMNVTFRLSQPELEAPLLAEAERRGFAGLKGHRSVGGVRASIYNAVEFESVRLLTDFLAEFARSHG